VVRWWDHCQAREEEEEDGGWVREGQQGRGAENGPVTLGLHGGV